MGETKSEQVLIRVTPTTHEEWIEAMNESRFTSLAEFIRFAVNNEIEGRGGDMNTDAFDDVRDDVTESLGEHHSAVLDRLESLEAAVGGVQRELDDGVDVGQDVVVEALPPLDESEYRDDPSKGNVGATTPDVPSRLYEDAVSAETVARKIEAPPEPVRRTLERLAMKSGRVQFLRGDGDDERRYYLDV